MSRHSGGGDSSPDDKFSRAPSQAKQKAPPRQLTRTATMIKQSLERSNGLNDASKLVEKYQSSSASGRLDRQQFWKVLKDLDPEKRDPLPVNFLWAWEMADEDGDGTISVHELSHLISKYQAFISSRPHIEALINECDTNRDHKMDINEMKILLERATGDEVTREDAAYVLDEVKNICRKITTGGYSAEVTSDPDFLAKAIAKWWIEKKMDGDTNSKHDSAIPALWQTKATVPRHLVAQDVQQGKKGEFMDDIWAGMQDLTNCCSPVKNASNKHNAHYPENGESTSPSSAGRPPSWKDVKF